MGPVYLYKEAPHLSEIYKTASKEFKFAKYLRNKFAAHIHPELLAKAIEWKPELRFLADRMDEQQIMQFCNLCVLETAINTYVDQSGDHLVFDSETDLFFPNDTERFSRFLEKVIRTGIQYLTELWYSNGGELGLLVKALRLTGHQLQRVLKASC